MLALFNKNLPKLVWTGFAFACVVVFGIGYLQYSALKVLIQSNLQDYSQSQTLTEINNILAWVNTAETSQGRYILTGEKEYLNLYRDSHPPIDVSLAFLRKAWSKHKTKIEKVNDLEDDLHSRFAVSDETLKIYEVQGHDAAIAKIVSGEGKTTMDDIRQDLHDMFDAENTEMLNVNAEDNKNGLRVNVISITGRFVAIGIIAIAAGALYKDIRSRQKIELNLRRQNSVTQLILDSMGDGVIVGQVDGSAYIFNPTMERILKKPHGFCPPQQMANHWGIYHPDTKKLYETSELPSQRAMRGEEIDNEEILISRPDLPQPVWIICSARPIREEQSIIGSVVIIRDTTAQKNASQQLKLMHELSSVVEETPEISIGLTKILERVCGLNNWAVGEIWTVENNGNTLICNPAWYSNLANINNFRNVALRRTFKRGEGLPGRVLDQKKIIVIPDIRVDNNFQRIESAKEAGLKTAIGLPIISHDIVIAVISFFLHESVEFNEKLIPFVTAISTQLGSVIERKLAETSLRESESRYHKLADVIPTGIFRTDVHGLCTYVNGGWTALSGMDIEEARGTGWLKAIHAEDRELVFSDWNDSVRQHIKFHKEYRFINTQTDKTAWVIGQASAEYNQYNEVTGYVGSVTDISERKQYEESLKQISEQLRRSNLELEQFAYIASHDLQEPLRMVASFVGLLEQKYKNVLDEKGKTYIYYAVDGANRMANLINDLLSYSRAGSSPTLEETKANESVATAVSNLQASIEESKAEITVDELPVLKVDPVHLTQVFQNMISNAIKYRSEDKPKIHIWATPENGHWIFSVKDNGIGIAEKDQGRIFQLFSRLHSRKKYPGTGLGLAICKKIVEKYSGTIGVESKEGTGSRFFFTLPRNPNGKV